MSYEVWTQEIDYQRRLEIVVIQRSEGRPNAYMPAPVWTQFGDDCGGELPDDGVWKLRKHEGEALLAAFADAAWKHGWRPKGHQAADTTAQQNHLDDMRTIVAKQLGVTFTENPK